MTQPLRLLVSDMTWSSIQTDVYQALAGHAIDRITVDEVLTGHKVADIAFISRDVTGMSTKFVIEPETQRFYDALSQSPDLRWLHVHSAGADRQIYLDLMARGVTVSTASGANARAVAQTALAGLLALARKLPQLMKAQRDHEWLPLLKTGLPEDLDGQTAVIVGWGPIAQMIGEVLHLLGVRIVVVRRSSAEVSIAEQVVTFDKISDVLPSADWLVLACPLNAQTHHLVNDVALSAIKPGAAIVNIARGTVIDEPAMIQALKDGRLSGAFLDVFAQEPLPSDSALWDLPNVIATPHTAGSSQGMYRRMEQTFTDNLARYVQSKPLHNVASSTD
ncbi:MAG: D-2-hydroxyacid dehydrogenase [Orrella sp.]